MNRKAIFVGMVVLVAVGLVAATITSSLGQREGAGQRGDRQGLRPGGDMMYLERTWTAVSFQLGCTSAQLAKLRPTYRTALQTRDSSVKQAMQAQDWEALRAAIAKCKQTLDAKLQQVLSDEQWTKLQSLIQARMAGPGGGMRPRPRAGRPIQ